MKVSEVMTSGAEVVSPESDLQSAAETMRRLDVGPLPVCDGQRLVGMITDRDITIRSTAEGRDPFTTLVRDVMTPDVLYVFVDQDVEEAARVMQENQVRRLPVLDRDKSLVGIVSLADIALNEDDENITARTLEEISEPTSATQPAA